MEITYNHKLFRFIDKEVSEVYKKYSHISREEATLIEAFIDKISSRGIDFDPYQDYKTTKQLAQLLEYEDDKDLIQLTLFLIWDIKLKVELEEARAIYDKLRCSGYVQIEKYLLYQADMESELEALAEEKLADDLEDVNKVMDLFDQEEIANMFIDSTSLTSAARQYIRDNGWQEALEITDVEIAFVDSNNTQVYCCINEWSDI